MRPEKEELEDVVRDSPIEEVAEVYGVTVYTIKQWTYQMGILKDWGPDKRGLPDWSYVAGLVRAHGEQKTTDILGMDQDRFGALKRRLGMAEEHGNRRRPLHGELKEMLVRYTRAEVAEMYYITPGTLETWLNVTLNDIEKII